MNTANLQLTGVLTAIAALADALRRKNILTREEIDTAFAEAERVLLTDPDRPTEVSRSNVEAMVFPLRYLRAANRMATDRGTAGAPFMAVATAVGQTKAPSRSTSDQASLPLSPPAP